MLSKLIAAIGVGFFIVLGLGGYVHAQFDELIPTRIGIIKFGGSPAVGGVYRLMSKPLREGPLLRLPSSSPATTGGSLTVASGSGTLSCTLAAGLFNGTVGWRELGIPAGSKGYKYLNYEAPTTDPCKLIVVTAKKIKVFAKGTGTLPVPLASGNPDVRTVLALGTDNYITLWNAPHYREKEALLIKAKNRYLFDNRDGTITDLRTGLMWEKKDSGDGTPNPANLHDADNTYVWAGCCDGDCSPPYEDSYCQPNAAAASACSAQTGGAVGCAECSVGTCDVDPLGRGAITTIWNWLVQASAEGGTGFAGYSDWRIPSEEGCNACWTGYPTYTCPCDPAELESILLTPSPCSTSPCIDPIFGPTASDSYWSSTPATYPSASAARWAWIVYFVEGNVILLVKDNSLSVRAVRGGSPSAAFLDVTSGVLD